ncbi:DNA ligase/mRNA capping enzyme [Mycena belliarum]|uniref:DNA ligase/mRNA capping enzyme n=1 Tax=Mycena belliarum TaxID=1033014 RepID=A0AAD6UJ09_9AGAR|nr:DNA ligase/mRNA capping enzyme [Mycena belliae]
MADELAEIDGHKPKVLLADGEDREVQSMSSNSTYKVKRTWDHYYCQCPSGSPVNARTCKHLRDLLGEAYETARLKWKNPNGPPPKPLSKKKPASKSKPASKAKPASKGKRKRDDDDDEDDEDDEDVKPKKKPKKPPKKKPASKAKKAKADDDDDEDDDDNSGGKKLPAVLLANKWDLDKGPDPTGWWISEKLDGVRTFYDGKGMVSRLGNPFTPPKWFLDKLPKDVTLDGELFAGRGQFQDTVSIVKTVNSPHWKEITFQIFDIPSENTVFEDRIATLVKLFGPGGKYECPEVVLVEHEKAKNRQHVLDKLKEIEGLGGEGLMLRRAGSKYEGRRSGTLLKIKTFYDAEAQVTGYTDGKGKNVGVIGALKCKMESGKTFNVGTGLSDKQRKSPPKVGSIIVYRFQELTRDGVPRFPSFIGEAIDKKKAKDAVIPPHRKTGASKD